jgi:endo-1,3-1,4-beta-glycanase ExoK
MMLSRKIRLYGIALLATAVGAVAAVAAESGFVDKLETYDKTFWRKSDGWANGWTKNDTGWVGRHIAIAGGRMSITLDDSGASGRSFASGEYQTHRFFGYGRFEARLKSVAAPGFVTGFFTYTGPTFNGAPHDEIDFEFLGKSPRQVQLNYFTDGKGGHDTTIDLGFDASADFHTYAFEWRPDSIRWFVDGRLVHEETGERGPLPSHPGKIYLHVWAGKDLEDWLGRISYPGHPLVAEVDCVSFRPLDSTEPGCGS